MSEAASGSSGESAELVEIARVIRPRGLRGELIARTHGEDPQLLLGEPSLLLDGRPGAIPHRVSERRALRRLPDGRWLVCLQLAGICDRSQAERWVSAAVRVPARVLEAARGADLYWRDLIGLECLDPRGTALGRIREIWARPSQDVLVVDGPSGQHLVPAADALLERVDLAARQIWLSAEAVAASVPGAGAPADARD